MTREEELRLIAEHIAAKGVVHLTGPGEPMPDRPSPFHRAFANARQRGAIKAAQATSLKHRQNAAKKPQERPW